RGREAFRRYGCTACHTVVGVSAGTIGPNLTHVGSRTTIAAGVLSNSAEDLARWIGDPPGVKPGAKMPKLPVPPQDPPALVASVTCIGRLRISAREVAFPRLDACSYWVFLLRGLFRSASGLLPNHPAPDAGWFGYANLTSREFSPGPNIEFWLLGLQILGVASLAAGFNFIVTILNLRAPGMKMMRLPVFSWMTLVTSFLIITAFPV